MNRLSPLARCGLVQIALLSLPALVAAQPTPHGGMLRYPDISATQIAFAYANDLWVAPREGGVATPLASPPGEETFPKFSPDGKTIAFIGDYDGNRDIYTVPCAGGIPYRVTHHSTNERVTEWTPDGKRLLFFAGGMGRYPRAVGHYSVAVQGGLPESLPVPYGANGALNADGTWLAYTPHQVDTRTWKRYRGGMATDVWLFNLKTHESKRITDWEGVDSLPMWQGQKVYYLSDDGPSHRQNIWVYDTANGQRRQVTTYSEWDVKWPSIGPGPAGEGEIVYQYGAGLFVLDLKTEQPREVKISIPGARPRLRPVPTDHARFIHTRDVSPAGKRAVVEARGDIWTLPARNGSPRNLTRTSGVAEREPTWSPDGKWIAYFSDATDEYQLYLAPADGVGAPRQITKDNKVWLHSPSWSPDSRHLAYWNKAGDLFLYTLDDDSPRKIDTEPWNFPSGVSWSSDSKWLAYTRTNDGMRSAIWLYNLDRGELKQATSGMFNDSSPAFDRKGDYLYFTSLRDFSSPRYEDVGTTFVYADTGKLYAIPLRADMTSPLAPKSDEEEPKKDEKKDGDAAESQATESKPAESQPAESAPASTPAESQASRPAAEDEDKQTDEAPKPVKIDLDGFERRAITLPLPSGRYTGLSVNDAGHLLYLRLRPRDDVEEEGGGGGASLHVFDISADEPKEKTVLSNVRSYSLSADGKKLLVVQGQQMAIVDAAADQKLDKPISTDGMIAEIDPRAEWRQIFTDAWRVQRDYFYDPHMHGVDWDKVRQQYGAMLEDATSREDVSYVIREMISELNVGHAYYWGGDEEPGPSLSVGMLGCDFALDGGAYKIARIYQGAPWDADARGPLGEPGLKVKEGDYLLAVNGAALDPAKDPWAAFQGLAGKVVTLTVSEKPTRDEAAHDVVVQLAGGEYDLRFRAWIEANRRYVEEKSGGKVGYIYVPDTGVSGQNELFRQFYSQLEKEALIIDERWNGGGQIPTRFIELLNRPRTNYWARRDGNDWPWPPDSHAGPKCMLINGLSGSGGDCFPAYFKQSKIGKVIGTRTWGGLVGISGNPGLIDDGYTSAPTFAYYELDGTWGIEGHGVDPDIEVLDDPAKMVGGKDPQLDAAIDLMLQEIQTRGFKPPKRPAYPDRRGMGIRPEDK